MNSNSIQNPNSDFQAMYVVNDFNQYMITTTDPVAVWTWSENKIFEDALVKFPDGAVNRWQWIADCLPCKSVDDVIAHYETLLYDVDQIDSGLIEIPIYSDELKGKGRSSVGSVKPKQGKRRKNKLWTIEEHRKFLLGLEIYGRGDWRNISRNLLQDRLPSQVASHAQKYFNRLKSDKKAGRKSSILDITSHDLPSLMDSLTVPQHSSIHGTTSHDTTSSPVDSLPVPQSSSSHDTSHDTTISPTDYCLPVLESSSIQDITCSMDSLTIPQPAYPPPGQQYFADISFSV